MTPSEREHLQKLDDLVLNASPDELKKIQDIDHRTQMDGLSLCHVYLDSGRLINKNTKKPSKQF